VTQILYDAGSGPGALPLLSYALTNLVDATLKSRGDEITWTLYNEIGCVNGAIQKETNEVMAELNPKPETLHRLFGRLVTVSPDGTATRKPAYPPATPDRVWTSEELELMRRLVDKRLLLTGVKEGTGIGTVDIAHEALLVQWTQLNKWIEGARADLQIMRSVEIEAREWQAELEKVSKPAPMAAVAGSTNTGANPEPLWQRVLTVHRTLLWPQDRLNRVYEAMEHLGWSLESLPPEVPPFIRKEADRLLDELKYPIPYDRRAFIGSRLSDLGDPRSGVGLRDGVPDIAWREVPPGEVTLYDEQGRALSTRHVARFRIAKFPVTLSQFELFTKPTVYFKPEWWTDLGVDPEKHRPRVQPAGPSYPAYYVSWPQAIAYCRWLSKLLGYTVCIPTEWQWQLAATSGDPTKLYPWGEKWEPENANHAGGLNRPVVVGLYPAGAALTDVFDISGNVYEWCLNGFDDSEFLGLTGPTHRASRGGAYFESSEHLTTRHRRRDPADGVNDLGRTIVVSIRLACDVSDIGQAAS
jgi:formylglycine-generating enzyme required for sulfatase activity